MNQIISDSIGNVSGFLQRHGIYIGETPTFAYTGEYSPFSRELIALVPGVAESHISDFEYTTKKRAIPHMQQFFRDQGIRLSYEASDELVDYFLQVYKRVMSLDNETLKKLNSYRGEILFFRSLEDILMANPSEKAAVIVENLLSHELWHLVEMRRGILSHYISEGTAEFCRDIHRRERSVNYAIPDIYDEGVKRHLMQVIVDYSYLGGYRIVRAHANSLSDLLDPEKRKRMESEYIAFVDATAKQYVKDVMERNEPTEEERDLLDLIGFGREPKTKEDLLNDLNKLGLTRMAEELESQDITGLLE